jgi:chromosome segregation ATPase
MNLVGKIIVVAIFILSLVFMSFAIALYATNPNWKEYVTNEQKGSDGLPIGVVPKLREVKKENEKLKKELEDYTKQRDEARNAHQQALAKLQSELELLAGQHKKLVDDLEAVEKAKNVSVADMSATLASDAKLREDLKKLKDQIADTRKDCDAKFQEVVQKTVDLNQALINQEQLRKRMDDLAKDLAKAKEAFEKVKR